MTNETRTLSSESDLPLHLRIWRPESSKHPEGAVILAHGLGEHTGRYGYLARHFTDHGFAVFGPDMVGFGRSGGRRGHLPGGIEGYKRELLNVAGLARKEVGDDARMIWLGHSMGGLAVLLAMFEQPETVEEAVVAAPALDSGRALGSLRRLSLRFLNSLTPSFTIDHGIPSELVCSDPEVVQAYKDDPLVHRRISVGLASSIFAGGAKISAAASAFERNKLLLLQGEEDRIAYPEVTRSFAERVSCEPKEYLQFAGMWHEVFNERERAQAFAAVDRFFAL
ncbi:MAG: alpha/beta fold hydrolase [Anaerolineales bacterium]